VYELVPNWPTCTLLVLYYTRTLLILYYFSTCTLLVLPVLYYFTGAALPSVSPINAGIRHAPCTVARDVAEVTSSLRTVAPSSVTAQPSNARQREARGREGRQDAAAHRYCCAIAFLEVSEFQQLPHGAITPQYCTL
jgi:hypothetical protein